jgi:hypothetical protein
VLRRLLWTCAAAVLLSACGGGDSQESTAPEVSGTPNLLTGAEVTADFETGTAGWSSTAGGEIVQDDQNPHSGSGALSVNTRGDGQHEGALTSPLDALPTVPGRRYKASTWVRAPQGASMELRLSERDLEGDHVETASTSFTGTGQWQFVEVDAKFGDRGRRASVHVYTRGAPRSVAFQVDDVVLARAD